MAADPRTIPKPGRRNLAVAGGCAAFVLFMLAMAYAAVPLYSLFCRTTGFGGVPRIAAAAPASTPGSRTLKVRFDTNVAGGLAWTFAPERDTIDVRLGEAVTVLFFVRNQTARETAGQAAFNVSPATAGGYFAKINCFCFNEQRLGPGEQREMPVVFFIDPALAQDPEQDRLNTITLSYTMYPARAPVGELQRGAAVGRSHS